MPVSRVIRQPLRSTRQTFNALRQIAVDAAGIFSYAYWSSTKCVFVLSTGRTGTDTLHRLLDLSPGIKSLHEPRPRLMAERAAAFQGQERNSLANKNRFKAARGLRLVNAKFRGETYVETSARMTFLAPIIAELLPNARFIFMHRHPGEVIRSGMRRGWYQGHPADEYRILPGAGHSEAREWSHYSSFEKICWYWKAYNRFSIQFLNQLPTNRWLDLPSERLFAAEPEDMRSLFSFVGVPVPDLGSVQEVIAQKSNSQSKGSFPRFQNWDREQVEILAKHASEEMDILGYEVHPVAKRIVG